MFDSVPPIFLSAYLKAHWASYHIKMLERAMRQYIDNNIRVSVQQPNGPDGEKIVKIETDKFIIPAHLAVGDIVRNLRDSLDHFISALFREKCEAGSEERSKFPVGKDRDDLKREFVKIFKCPSVANFGYPIFNLINPTLAADSPFIYKFNKINNSDKHRELVIVYQLIRAPLANWVKSENFSVFMDNGSSLAPGHNFTQVVPAGAKVMDDAHFKPSLKITFGPSEFFANADVVPTLLDCHKATCSALDELLKTYRNTLSGP